MIGDLKRRLVELRFLEGVEKVEHVPYSTGDQFWVRFNKPLDLQKLQEALEKHGYSTVRFAKLPSKLPPKLAEVLWDGVKLIIGKNFSRWTKFKASLGFEPEGIAKIAADLHGPYEIFMATNEEGIQILYEYLGLKYVAPAPPPPRKQAAPAMPVPSPAVSAPKLATPVPPATRPQQPAPAVSSSPPTAPQRPAATPPTPPKTPAAVAENAPSTSAESNPPTAAKPTVAPQPPAKKEEDTEKPTQS